jgi:BirA family biotin operon repressor/biotin-[acetyl-CoA-carboxylase] ligase
LYVYEQVASTNDEAATLAAQGAREGATVLAVAQTGGRGRRSRAWSSPAGGLWLSIVLRPALPAERWPLVGFAAAVGAGRAVEDITSVRVRLKWPNDLMVDEHKVGGVLVEARGPVLIAGIGLNANIEPETFAPDVRRVATSLSAVLGRSVDLVALARALLERFEAVYELLTGETDVVLAMWRARDLTRGRSVRISGAQELEGVAEDVDQTGALLVRTADGLRRVVAGDVSVRTVSTPRE